MHIELESNTKKVLKEKQIIFERANINQLEEIIEIYKERAEWFKERKINQWSRYIERHENEFPIAINNQNYYILKKDNKIIAGIQISYNPGDFKDNSESIYLNKLVTKVGYKNLGKIIFRICRDIARKNNKKYLRLQCLKSNEKLNEIYEKHGFKLLGCGKTYYEYCLRECNIYE